MNLLRRKLLAWTTPTVATVVLPAHAQTSEPTNSETFIANGVFIVPEEVTEITAIVNGGGGGFGIQGGLGATIISVFDGGSGEQLTQTFIVNSGESYAVTIGHGGYGYTGSIPPSGQGGVGHSNGQDARGGGGGGSSHFNGIEASGGAGGNIPGGRGGGPNGGVAGTNGGRAGNGLGAPGQVYIDGSSSIIPPSDGSVIVQWTV